MKEAEHAWSSSKDGFVICGQELIHVCEAVPEEFCAVLMGAGLKASETMNAISGTAIAGGAKAFERETRRTPKHEQSQPCCNRSDLNPGSQSVRRRPAQFSRF
jgi:hypothetical protein